MKYTLSIEIMNDEYHDYIISIPFPLNENESYLKVIYDRILISEGICNFSIVSSKNGYALNIASKSPSLKLSAFYEKISHIGSSKTYDKMASYKKMSLTDYANYTIENDDIYRNASIYTNTNNLTINLSFIYENGFLYGFLYKIFNGMAGEYVFRDTLLKGWNQYEIKSKEIEY